MLLIITFVEMVISSKNKKGEYVYVSNSKRSKRNFKWNA